MADARPTILSIAKSGTLSALAVMRAAPALFGVCLVASIGGLFLARKAIATSADPFDIQVLTFGVANALYAGVVTSIIAVVVHRFVILSETSALDWLLNGRRAFAEFYVVSVAVTLVCLALSVPLDQILPLNLAFLMAMAMFALIIYSLVYLFRIFLLFPGIAVEAPGRSLASAKRAGKGLALRFFAASMLILAPLIVTNYFVFTFDGGFNAPGLIALLFQGLVSVFATAALAASASHLFLWRQNRLNGADPLRINAPAP